MQRAWGRVKLTEVNPHLVCVLCHGYFIDATTMVECPHSFCRSCIILHLETKSFCPICEVQIHKTKPHLHLKPDKTLQDIVYKLVPGLFHSEMRRRREFYVKYPNHDLYLSSEARGVGVDRIIYSPEDSISLSIEYYDDEKEKEEWVAAQPGLSGFLKPAASLPMDGLKRYLKCPAVLTMSQIKKLVRSKFDLTEKCPVEVLYRRESLPDSYSLMDVAYIYTWKQNEPMRFYYRIQVPIQISRPLLSIDKPAITEVINEPEYTTIKKHADANIEKETTITTHEDASIEKETTITTHEDASIEKETTITTHEDASIEKETTITTHEDASIEKETTIKTHEDASIEKKTTIKTHEDASIEKETKQLKPSIEPDREVKQESDVLGCGKISRPYATEHDDLSVSLLLSLSNGHQRVEQSKVAEVNLHPPRSPSALPKQKDPVNGFLRLAKNKKIGASPSSTVTSGRKSFPQNLVKTPVVVKHNGQIPKNVNPKKSSESSDKHWVLGPSETGAASLDKGNVTGAASLDKGNVTGENKVTGEQPSLTTSNGDSNTQKVTDKVPDLEKSNLSTENKTKVTKPTPTEQKDIKANGRMSQPTHRKEINRLEQIVKNCMKKGNHSVVNATNKEKSELNNEEDSTKLNVASTSKEILKVPLLNPKVDCNGESSILKRKLNDPSCFISVNRDSSAQPEVKKRRLVTPDVSIELTTKPVFENNKNPLKRPAECSDLSILTKRFLDSIQQMKKHAPATPQVKIKEVDQLRTSNLKIEKVAAAQPNPGAAPPTSKDKEGKKKDKDDIVSIAIERISENIRLSEDSPSTSSDGKKSPMEVEPSSECKRSPPRVDPKPSTSSEVSPTSLKRLPRLIEINAPPRPKLQCQVPDAKNRIGLKLTTVRKEVPIRKEAQSVRKDNTGALDLSSGSPNSPKNKPILNQRSSVPTKSPPSLSPLQAMSSFQIPEMKSSPPQRISTLNRNNPQPRPSSLSSSSPSPPADARTHEMFPNAAFHQYYRHQLEVGLQSRLLASSQVNNKWRQDPLAAKKFEELVRNVMNCGGLPPHPLIFPPKLGSGSDTPRK